MYLEEKKLAIFINKLMMMLLFTSHILQKRSHAEMCVCLLLNFLRNQFHSVIETHKQIKKVIKAFYLIVINYK